MANEMAPLLAHSYQGSASIAKTFGNIIISIVGSGVLGLPFTFKLSGWAVSSSAIVLCAALTYYCMLLLVRCRNKLEDYSHRDLCTYGDLGRHAYGNIGKTLVDIMIVVSQSGCCVAYLIFIGQNLSSIFTGTSSRRASFIFSVIPFQICLAWVRSLTGLAPFSIFADICNVLAMAIVISDDFKNLQNFDNAVAFRAWQGLPFAMGVAVYCYEGFGMTLTLETSMKEPQKFAKVLGQAFILITILYVGFGFIGYLAFGDGTLDIITLNLPNNWSTIAVKSGLCIALFFTFPVMMYPVHEILERILSHSIFQSFSEAYPTVFGPLLYCVRGCAVFIIAVIAVSVPGFGVFISLVGSTVCGLLAFVFPALFHLKISANSIFFVEKVFNWLLILFGVIFAIYGTYSAWVDASGSPSQA